MLMTISHLYSQPMTYQRFRLSGPGGELRDQLGQILGHKPSFEVQILGLQTAKPCGFLDEVGKQRPITAGVVINQGKIDDIQVLGFFAKVAAGEVKYDFFTAQFDQLWLQHDHQLSQSVDNVTGATLSVKAMTRMAKAALLLHQYTNQATHTLAHAR